MSCEEFTVTSSRRQGSVLMRTVLGWRAVGHTYTRSVRSSRTSPTTVPVQAPVRAVVFEKLRSTVFLRHGFGFPNLYL